MDAVFSWAFNLEGCTSLNLSSHDSIGAKGARALAEALKVNNALATLSLGTSSIGDKGAQALAELIVADGQHRRTQGS